MSIPSTVAPIFYDQSQILSISPQLDELIMQCDQLLSEANQTVVDADKHIELAKSASESLQRPLALQQRARAAELQMRQLRARAGISAPRPEVFISFGHCTIQGRRATNEDAHAVTLVELDGRRFNIAGVFDGHAGDQAAIFCGENYTQMLQQNEMFPAAIDSALRTCFLQMDRAFLQTCRQSGCTAVAAVFDAESNVLYTANAGDARCVIGTRQKYIEGTHDHKPNEIGERARVEAAGSFVTTMFGVPRVNGMLAVSRAIGDDEYKQFGVIAEPDVHVFEVDDLEYILLACDGLFDVLNNEQVDSIVRGCFGLIQPEEEYPLDDQMKLFQKVARYYMEGNVEEADQCLLAAAGMTFVNFKVCTEPTQNMTREDRCAATMTRMAYLLGSTDNITVLIGLVDQN
ncbi:Protein phosphatase 2C [Spironucleus salmonicida]|uniref:Protein phosphatase 2C n=1 Tax=Spironucleus salmonicida TaxID=348837 RepID=V6LG99_9EUKA|nr:Protein phosphatase 2C [Spironucleus salmonicida]|eukprot:EST43552.1 Protein phosphatase 2C [Spironucleus salmonicida]